MLFRFLRDRRGGVLPMLAFTAVPLMAGVGVAVDYSRANATKAQFQAALDATALMLSKNAANLSASDLQAQATKFFTALFTNTQARDVAINTSYSGTGGSKVLLTGSATLPTNFLGLLGYSQLPIGASATATWGNTRLRVALVLDNTGSMASDDKMTALKTAAHGLLSQLQAAATNPEDVYVSIVPFNKDVNIGSTNYAASWLRWDLWEAVNGSCSISKYGSSQSRCTNNGGTWTPDDHSTWNGCLTDRDQNYDTTNDSPLAGATLYPAEQYSSCPASLMGLSNDWTALSTKIDDMTPVGNTNQAIGLQMGWQSLTQSPFTIPAFDPDYKYSQVVILLTDGLNTQDRWYSYQSSIDTRQEKTCANVKAAGITVYTVQVNTGGDPTSTLLQSCASDPNKFFLLTSSTEIPTTFSQIGTALTQLRLSM
jgi:Flp pilus assembly protein TadG